MAEIIVISIIIALGVGGLGFIGWMAYEFNQAEKADAAADKELRKSRNERFEKDEKKVRGFRRPGERFNFMGQEFMCVALSRGAPHAWIDPHMEAVYVDADGVVRKWTFGPHEIEILEQENT